MIIVFNRKSAKIIPLRFHINSAVLRAELDVFSKNKLLLTVIKNTIIFQTSNFETGFVIFTMFAHVIVKSIFLKI